MSDKLDILIAGGGPAGLGAAIRARQHGLTCAVVEPKPAPIDKACGEGLMPAALDLLDRLGVERPAGHPFRGIRYVDAYQRDLNASGDFERPGLGVRRLELYRTLCEHAERVGVERVSAKVRHIDQRPDGVEAAGRRARYLLAADGLHSSLRRQLGLETSSRHPPRYGVRRHYRVAPWVDRVEVHWGRLGEAYVTPVAQDTIGVAFLAPDGGRFDDLLDGFPLLRQRLAGAQAVSQERGGGPFEQRVERRVIGRILLVGDAAGYLDPLTGEGIALALATASAAVDAIAAGQPDAYERHYRRLTREYYWMTGLLLQISRRRWLHRPMLGLLDRAPLLFDKSLELLGGRAHDAVQTMRSQ